MITYLLALAGELVKLLKTKGEHNLQTRKKIVRIKQALAIAKTTQDTSKIELMLADLGIELPDKGQNERSVATKDIQREPQKTSTNKKTSKGQG